MGCSMLIELWHSHMARARATRVWQNQHLPLPSALNDLAPPRYIAVFSCLFDDALQIAQKCVLKNLVLSCILSLLTHLYLLW